VTIKDRPYIGSWVMNKTVVRHTPDCVVYINGHPEIAGCQTCNQVIDIQKYITTVSVEPSVEPVATATIELAIPKTASAAFGLDANPILKVGLEVVIFMRGYFPVEALWEDSYLKELTGVSMTTEGGYPGPETKANMYPYYQVFRGVVTEFSFEYNSGKYSASMSCGDILHHWQYLYLATNGSIWGPRPENSMVAPNMMGHELTNMSPFSIMYTLCRTGFGAAYSVNWAHNQQTNTAAVSKTTGEAMMSHMAEYWEERWQQPAGSLRMYGIDGTLYNSFSQAYLGLYSKDGDSQFDRVTRRLRSRDSGNATRLEGGNNMQQAMRKLEYNRTAAIGSILPNTKGDEAVLLDVMKMLAYSTDISAMANPAMFETEYMSKLEVANAVKDITGFEFYQDVDGDLVFKPPFYNLDTSADPVYVIKDSDIISLSETSREPEATMCKATGSGITNMRGTGLDGEWGKSATYIDFRLVAQYGWRENTIECNYFTSVRALYVTLINRLDVVNAGIHSASISIPIRPELRPGYPVYIEGIDTFYYIQSMSHSFSFGGQCTTTIQGIGRRQKFCGPGEVSSSTAMPKPSQIKLNRPELPRMPLFAYPQNVGDLAGTEDAIDGGPMRIVGFPNVVLALNVKESNLSALPISEFPTLETYLWEAKKHGILSYNKQQDVFYTMVNNTETGPPIQLSEIRTAYTTYQEAIAKGKEPAMSSAFGMILSRLKEVRGTAIEDDDILQNWMTLQQDYQSRFSPGGNLPGRYVYYSCSHPDVAQQAPPVMSAEDGKIVFSDAAALAAGDYDVLKLYDKGSEGTGVLTGPPERGIKVMALTSTSTSDPSTNYRVVPTSDIRYVTFAAHEAPTHLTLLTQKDGASFGHNFIVIQSNIKTYVRAELVGYPQQFAPDEALETRFSTAYIKLSEMLQQLTTGLDVFGWKPSRDSKISKMMKMWDGVPENTPMMWASIRVSKRGKVTISEPRFFPGGYEITNAYRPQYGENDDAILLKLSTTAADNFAKVLAAILDVTVTKLAKAKDSGEYADEEIANLSAALFKTRNAFLASLINFGHSSNSADQLARAVPGGATVVRAPVTNMGKSRIIAPVFPVSDSRGYEVVGSLPYGRGLDVEKYTAIVRAGRNTENYEMLAGQSVNIASFETIDDFLVAYSHSLNASKAFQCLTAEQQAQLAMETGFYSDYMADRDRGEAPDVGGLILMGLVHGNSHDGGERVRNNIVTNYHWTQKTSEIGAPIGLSNISSSGSAFDDLCKCSGTDAGLFSLAFGSKYSSVGEWAKENARNKVEGYQYGLDAIQGEVMEQGYNSVVDQWNATFGQNGSYGKNFNSTGKALSQAFKKGDKSKEDEWGDIQKAWNKGIEGAQEHLDSIKDEEDLEWWEEDK